MNKSNSSTLPLPPNKIFTNALKTLLTLFLFTVSGINILNAQITNAGVYDSYITIGSTEYYVGTSGQIPAVLTTNALNKPKIKNVNFGSFSSTASLNITAAEIFTWRSNNGNLGNICGGANFYYAIYQTGKPSTFAPFSLPSNPTSGNTGTYYWQEWATNGSPGINVLAGLAPGKYYCQFYIDVTGDQNANDCNQHIYVNGLPDSTVTANYTFSFTIKGAKCPPAPPTGAELITNGQFAGGTAGYNTQYSYTPAPTTGNNSEPGEYFIGTAPQVKTWNAGFLINGSPSGGTTDSFMVVDGDSSAAPFVYLKVWTETVPVTKNTTYTFSFYVASMDATSPARLYLYANDTAFGGEALAPGTPGNWTKVTKTWCSGSNTSVTINIIDSNQIKVGNDFALDSISLRSSATYSSITAGPDTTICNGNSVTFNATPGACTYTWSPSASLNNDSIPTPVASPTTSTTYTLMAVVPGCTNDTLKSNVVVTVGTNIPVSAGGNVSTCGGVGVTLHGTGGSIYTWSPSTGLSSSTVANPVATPVVTTTYHLTATSPGGCTGTDSAIVTVSASLKATTRPSDTTVCNGQPVQFQASGANQYSWSPSAGLSNSTIANPVASPTSSTTYTVTVSNGLGCSATGTVVLTVGSTIHVSAGGNVSTCLGVGVTLNGSGGATYIWSPSNGLSSSTISNPVATPTITTTYHLTASNLTGCSGSDSAIVTVGVLKADTHPADTAICSGRSTQIHAANANVVTWSPVTGLSSATISNPVASPTASTTYTVTMSNGAGCTASGTVAITVNPSSVAGVVSSQKDSICPNTVAHLSVKGNSGAVVWQSSATGTKSGYTTLSSTGTTLVTSPLTQTAYYRVIVGAGECADTSAVDTLVVIPGPVAKYVYNVNGHTINFDGSASTDAVTYTWDFGDGSPTSAVIKPTHTFDSASTYQVCLTVRNNSNCSFTLCQNVTTYPNGVNNISFDNSWMVYPDPFNSQLYISTGNALVRAQSVEVFDVLGRRVYFVQNIMQNPFKIDLGNLAAGTYLVRLISSQGAFVKTVIKE